MVLIVKRLGIDRWNRPKLRNVVNGAIYVNVDLNEDLLSSGWHTVSGDGEPECPLRRDIKLIEFKETEYYISREVK